MNTFEAITAAADGLKAVLPKGFIPTIGLISGSGLSGIADAIKPIGSVRDEISYSDIKGFPVSAVQVSVFLSPSCGSYRSRLCESEVVKFVYLKVLTI